MSWLSQPVSLGHTTLPSGLLLYVLLAGAVVAGLNGLYLQRHQGLLRAIRERHPEVYESLRAGPDVAGVAYSKGYRRVLTLKAFVPRLRELQDPALEEQFLAFLRFDRRFFVLAPLTIVVLLVVGLVLGRLLTPS